MAIRVRQHICCYARKEVRQQLLEVFFWCAMGPTHVSLQKSQHSATGNKPKDGLLTMIYAFVFTLTRISHTYTYVYVYIYMCITVHVYRDSIVVCGIHICIWIIIFSDIWRCSIFVIPKRP